MPRRFLRESAGWNEDEELENAMRSKAQKGQWVAPGWDRRQSPRREEDMTPISCPACKAGILQGPACNNCGTTTQEILDKPTSREQPTEYQPSPYLGAKSENPSDPADVDARENDDGNDSVLDALEDKVVPKGKEKDKKFAALVHEIAQLEKQGVSRETALEVIRGNPVATKYMHLEKQGLSRETAKELIEHERMEQYQQPQAAPQGGHAEHQQQGQFVDGCPECEQERGQQAERFTHVRWALVSVPPETEEPNKEGGPSYPPGAVVPPAEGGPSSPPQMEIPRKEVAQPFTGYEGVDTGNSAVDQQIQFEIMNKSLNPEQAREHALQRQQEALKQQHQEGWTPQNLYQVAKVAPTEWVSQSVVAALTPGEENTEAQKVYPGEGRVCSLCHAGVVHSGVCSYCKKPSGGGLHQYKGLDAVRPMASTNPVGEVLSHYDHGFVSRDSVERAKNLLS